MGASIPSFFRNVPVATILPPSNLPFKHATNVLPVLILRTLIIFLYRQVCEVILHLMLCLSPDGCSAAIFSDRQPSSAGAPRPTRHVTLAPKHPIGTPESRNSDKSWSKPFLGRSLSIRHLKSRVRCEGYPHRYVLYPHGYVFVLTPHTSWVFRQLVPSAKW